MSVAGVEVLTSKDNVPHVQASSHQLPYVPLLFWLKVQHLHSPSNLGKLSPLIQALTL